MDALSLVAAWLAEKLGQESPIHVQPLTDWQMVRMLASENATQRGTTAAASLDAIAAISTMLIEECCRSDAETVANIFLITHFPQSRHA